MLAILNRLLPVENLRNFSLKGSAETLWLENGVLNSDLIWFYNSR